MHSDDENDNMDDDFSVHSDSMQKGTLKRWTSDFEQNVKDTKQTWAKELDKNVVGSNN